MCRQLHGNNTTRYSLYPPIPADSVEASRLATRLSALVYERPFNNGLKHLQIHNFFKRGSDESSLDLQRTCGSRRYENFSCPQGRAEMLLGQYASIAELRGNKKQISRLGRCQNLPCPIRLQKDMAVLPWAVGPYEDVFGSPGSHSHQTTSIWLPQPPVQQIPVILRYCANDLLCSLQPALALQFSRSPTCIGAIAPTPGRIGRAYNMRDVSSPSGRQSNLILVSATPNRIRTALACLDAS